MPCKHELDVPPLVTRIVINVNAGKISICTWSGISRAWDYRQFKQVNKPLKLRKVYEKFGYKVTVQDRKYTVLEKCKASNGRRR